ncbi:hypothetical protein FisN_34Lh002 [Fistulifera solaris]|uniref:Digalactosyldiacylglycerol synthase n=1 Tax=Fistulifera solaris TaxID=1519565 RepID=A0A1Z5JHC1_FISSO|nr:hypothetical protein FisN_34Lh002 [Fistulifera solaris]|eukprot:GAX13403.1 hypothetical protein FisN_34Lh002 [Fistulifera solaris]
METSLEATAKHYVKESDLRSSKRHIWIVTTAALPWRTGTAVNPLLRALYLMQQGHHVTLMIPWIEDEASRKMLYGDIAFNESADQCQWICQFCQERAGIASEPMGMVFWKGVYHHGFGSIFPAEDICAMIPAEQADVAILEEPEHLNWFRVPSDEASALGWAHKFNHVIGILHTNYGSYVKQYGMGTSLLTAPALNALSALVIRAYCHRVIRLSGTLTSLVPKMELTVNVHGVRNEFFQHHSFKGFVNNLYADNRPPEKCAAVYFIGKLIWAKGFESVLELQERYRATTGDYFAMDVYGSGSDEKSIRLAFFGRSHRPEEDDQTYNSDEFKLAKDIFDRDESLRSMLRDRDPSQAEGDGSDNQTIIEEDMTEKARCGAPLDVISDLTRYTLGTGRETAGAALHLAESLLQRGIGSFSRKLENKKASRMGTPFSLGPTIAAYKWRRKPLPARFLGVKDHIELKDLPQNIFLNMSTSEVLCTTSAEALAMGKFVILPKHPSNDFFVQFPNCLAYDDLDDCVEKLQYALSHSPTKLSEEDSFKLSWEGATERLYDAALREESTPEEKEQSRKAAQFHIETSKKSQYVSNLFGVLPL